MKLSILDISLLIGYAAFCIGIGFWSSRGHKDDDYLIAGRKMTLFGFVSSVVASYVGGAAIVAYSAYVYQFGISAIAVFAGTAIGFLVFIPYALKLRKISGKKSSSLYRIGFITNLIAEQALFQPSFYLWFILECCSTSLSRAVVFFRISAGLAMKWPY